MTDICEEKVNDVTDITPPDLLDDDDWDDEEEFDDTIRAKWTMDGATTLSEAAAKLRAFADWLEEIERKGHQLTQPVDSDYGFIRPRLPREDS